ncbi:MAG: GNAT family protein [Actinomycetota bacterium]
MAIEGGVPMTELRGERVVLRSFRPEEIEEVLTWWGRETGYFRAPPDANEEHLRRRFALSGVMTRFELLLAIEGDGRLVGEIQGRRTEGSKPEGVFELGVEVYEPADRGKGYGTDATRLLTSHLFESEKAHRVQAWTAFENEPMRRVLERVGFTFEGVLRGFRSTPEGLHDFAMYGITKGDWEKGETG